MKKKLLNNYGLKLLAVLCAILLWIAIINANDPYDKTTITRIPVTLTNTAALIDNGYLYDVVDSSDYVTITVRGPRSIVENLKASDFSAEAKIINEFTESARIEVECTKSGIDTDNLQITMKHDEVKLDIQNRVTKDIDIIPVITGNPADGYYTDDSCVSISPSTIKVSGPENIVEQISSIKAVFDVTGESANITTTVKPKLYDAANKLISNEKLTFSKDSITYKLDILSKKTVDVQYAVTGNVADGYRYTSITSTIPEVVIAGTEIELAKIDQIEIPASLIDLSNLNEDKVFKISISQYVPDSVKYLTEANTASVTVKVEQLKTRSVNLINSDITLKNLKDGYKAEFADNSVNTVIIKGLEKDITDFTSTDFIAEADLTGLKEGMHSVSVKITSKKDVEIVGNYKINIKVTESDVTVGDTEDPTITDN